MAEKPILLSLKHGPRKHILIVATDQSIQSSTYKTPALLALCFHFLPWEKGNVWSKLESSKACLSPNVIPSSCSIELALDEQKSSVQGWSVSHSQETTDLLWIL